MCGWVDGQTDGWLDAKFYFLAESNNLTQL